MSFEYYANWWVATKENLEKLYSKDEELRKKPKPLNGRTVASMLVGGLYAKYSLLVQELDTCLDQMVQPQKRSTVKKLVDAATIRLLELNEEMKIISISEIHYIDDTLIEQKLIPSNIEMLHPSLIFPRPISMEDIYKKYKKGETIYVPPKLKELSSDNLAKNRSSISQVGKTKSINQNINNEQPETEQTEEVNEEAQEEQEQEADKKKSKKSKKKLQTVVIEEKVLTEEEILEQKRKQASKDTVKVIQIMERARASRLYFNEVYEEVMSKQAIVPGGKLPPPPDPALKEKGALHFQKLWRGHKDRQFLRRKEAERRLLIGMTEPSWKTDKEFQIFRKNLEIRRELRDLRRRQYEQAIIDERNRLLRIMAPGLFEDISEEIREWFHVWYDSIKMFDEYPPENKGGSILIVRMETMTPKEYLDEYERQRRAKVKGKPVDKKAEQEKLKKLKEQEKEKLKKEAEKKKKEALAKKKKRAKMKPGDFEYEIEQESAAGKPYGEGQKEYNKFWKIRPDLENPLQTHYMDIIHDDKCLEIQFEVRKKVDEMLRIELDLLKAAREEDIIRMTGKKGKSKKPKKEKKGKKGKGKKDPTGDRTPEELFQELQDAGIIRSYPKVELDQFHGDFNYKGWNLRLRHFDPPPCLLDLRQQVLMTCVVPLGIGVFKRPRSVLIAGPRQSGKHLLANAIFNLTNCVLFDLSPEVVVGKYPGPKGMKMLLHLINKMTRMLAPSIIFFDGAERIFYSKVPKEERDLDPKRIGGKLVSGIIKTIKPEDRVMVLGITGKPWAASGAKLKKAFEGSILIPRPDYNSIYMFWRELLMPYHGVDRNFNFSALTTMTTQFPYTTLKKVVEDILTPRRIIQLSYKPLTPEEIYEYFLVNDLKPIDDKEYKKFVKWYSKTPIGKERAAFNKAADKLRETESKKGKK